MTKEERERLNGRMRQAARAGDLPEMKRLVAAGARVDSVGDGMTALQWSAKEGHLPVVKCLVEKGAQVDLKTKSHSAPLHHAIWRGDIDMVKFFLGKGARVDIRENDGEQPLHTAAYGGAYWVATALCLIVQGGELEAVDCRGRRPLHVAARMGQKNMAGFLLGAGANPYAADNNGETPMDLAKEHPEALAVFAEWEEHCGEKWRRETQAGDVNAHWARVKKHLPSGQRPSL